MQQTDIICPDYTFISSASCPTKWTDSVIFYHNFVYSFSLRLNEVYVPIATKANSFQI